MNFWPLGIQLDAMGGVLQKTLAKVVPMTVNNYSMIKMPQVIFWNGVECTITEIQGEVIQLEEELDELLEELKELDAGGERPAGGNLADELCISDIPTSGEKGAVQLAFYKN